MLTVYLDSNDYSGLSEKNLTDEFREIKEQLLEFSRSNQVRFVYSSMAICEAAPIEEKAIPFSIRRGELISELCDRNAMIDFHSLLSMEIEVLFTDGAKKVSAFNESGQWYPDMDLCFHENYAEEWFNIICEKEKPGRDRRRDLQRMFLKKNGPTEGARKILNGIDRVDFSKKLMAEYPMRREKVDVLVGYFFGKYSAKNAEDALHDGLRDPKWAMRWIAESSQMSEIVSNVVRKPAIDMNRIAMQLIEATKEQATIFRKLSEKDPVKKNGELAKKWGAASDQRLLDVANRLGAGRGLKREREVVVADVKMHCPGLSTLLESVFSSYWKNVEDPRMKPPVIASLQMQCMQPTVPMLMFLGPILLWHLTLRFRSRDTVSLQFRN